MWGWRDWLRGSWMRGAGKREEPESRRGKWDEGRLLATEALETGCRAHVRVEGD